MTPNMLKYVLNVMRSDAARVEREVDRLSKPWSREIETIACRACYIQTSVEWVWRDIFGEQMPEEETE